MEKLDSIFRAHSVAIIGASTDPNHLGRQILDNLLGCGYAGRVYPVNPKAEEIHGLRCYPSVKAIEEPLDLGVLAVPRAAVLPVVEDCIAKRVGGLVVITAGFRELDAEGAALEAALRRRVRRAGIPMLGPNCMGLFNADPEVRLNLTFSAMPPRSGHVAFLSQSGALGVAVQNLAEQIGLGFSIFASLGNEACVNHRQALEYAAADGRTRVIMLYLETFEEPAEFLRVARRVTERKPVLCLKGGRTETGARAAGSHTGALATVTRAFDAVMRQSGIVAVETTEEMLNVALTFERVPLPRGKNVRVLTNAGGPGVLATDMLARRGLCLPPLGDRQQAALREFVPPHSPGRNPADLTAAGTPEMYRGAARVLLDDPATDALLAIFVEPPRVAGAGVLAELGKAAAATDKPVVAAFPAQELLRRAAAEHKMAVLDYPESAALALGSLAQYASWKERPRGHTPRFNVNRQRVANALARAEKEGRRALDPEESLKVLRAYGIPVAGYAFLGATAQLAAVAQEVGFPLAMKVVSPAILHKTEVGGVVLNIRSQDELRRQYRALMARLRARDLLPQLRGMLLQEMAPGGRELILGFRRDAGGTPLLLVGLGGVFVEALEAVAVRVLPVTDQDVREMLAEMPGSRILGAFRGRPPVALPRLEQSLLRLAQLCLEFEAIAEVDVNPFVVSADPAGCKAVDARILLG